MMIVVALRHILLNMNQVSYSLSAEKSFGDHEIV